MIRRLLARSIFLFLAFALTACAMWPSIGCGMSCSDQQLTEKLRQRFPPGSPSAALTRELHREGFRVNPAQGEAVFVGGIFPACEVDTHVSWFESEGRITDISGRTTEACM
jgi:hypothetical protein